MVNDKKMEGISDLRDESDRDGIRVVSTGLSPTCMNEPSPCIDHDDESHLSAIYISSSWPLTHTQVIELKRDAVPSVVENNLFKKTPLQTSFSGNFLALSSDGRQPQRMTLRDSIQTFIDFRFKVGALFMPVDMTIFWANVLSLYIPSTPTYTEWQTIRRRTQFELQKVEARDHVVEGLIRALDRIDDVVDLVRKAKDTADAKAVLMSSEYEMSEAQASAILALTLGR